MKVYKLELKNSVEFFTKNLFYTLFEEEKEKQSNLEELKVIFLKILDTLSLPDGESVWKKFFEQLPTVRRQLDLDALAIEQNDPAAKSLDEVYLAYPGFQAIAIYRLSNVLYKLNLKIVPRMMTEYGHSVTGTDINPGATIGESFFIDHATGTVIGETVIIKDNVKLYQGVTLGAFHVEKSMASTKRHPTIESNVIIYANATILGGTTTVGKNSTIGASVWVTKSVPENSFVYHRPKNLIKTNNDEKK